MNRRIRSAMVFAALLALAASAAAIESGSLGPEAVKKRWHSRLAGMHFSARVQLSMDMGGIHEERELLVWRTDEAVGAERVMVRFTQPESVRNVGVLFLEQQGRPNDYFLYQPELRRVRRLPEAIASDDVYGIDLEFLGFGVAQSEPTEILDMAPETLDGRPTYRLRERALRPNPRFEERLTWIDASSFIPVRTEQFRAGAKRLVARTTEIRDADADGVREHHRQAQGAVARGRGRLRRADPRGVLLDHGAGESEDRGAREWGRGAQSAGEVSHRPATRIRLQPKYASAIMHPWAEVWR